MFNIHIHMDGVHVHILLFRFKPNIKGYIEDAKFIPSIVHSLLCSQEPKRKGYCGVLKMGPIRLLA